MGRFFSEFATESDVVALQQLVNKSTLSGDYAGLLGLMGMRLADVILNLNPDIKSACVATNALVADNLGAGMISALEPVIPVHLSCFWNNLAKGIVTITRAYHESSDFQVLIMVTPVISTGATVAANLRQMLRQSRPEKVVIATPVMHKNADSDILDCFASEAARIDFVWFAKDDVRTYDNVLLPGVGGHVVRRLGFTHITSHESIAIVPDIVQKRRQQFLNLLK